VTDFVPVELTLVLTDPDALRLVARSIDNLFYVYDQCALQSEQTVARELDLGRPSEARRNEARVVEYRRRMAVLAELRAQLPLEESATILAPMGES
jgi:hypothetical protein